MNTKTMEGLVGAKTNMEMANTPFRVLKEARRRGDTATMERAMGYMNDLSEKAESYQVKADEGMKEDAKEAELKTKRVKWIRLRSARMAKRCKKKQRQMERQMRKRKAKSLRRKNRLPM